MITQVQINSAARQDLVNNQPSSASFFTVALPDRLCGVWELSYALIPVVTVGSLTMRITISNATPSLWVTSRGTTLSLNFSIGVTAAAGANQEYTPRNRQQKVDFGREGLQSLTILITDETNTQLNFNGKDWLMVLQQAH